MRPAVLITLIAMTAAAAGCRMSRYYLDEPVHDRVLTKVYSGDRFVISLDEPASGGFRWFGKCDTGDIRVWRERTEPPPADRPGAPGKAVMHLHVHRGFSEPATVTLECRRPSTGEVRRTVTLVLHADPTDEAPWMR